jgi:hypothetical protein
MSSKTPLPGRALRARDKESQRHPGKPDQPRPRRSTQEVQAEKAEKARVLAEKECMCSETIQATAKLEKHMEAQLKEKLSTAHHPPPSTQKRVLRATAKKSLAVVPEGMAFFLKRFCVKSARPDKGARSSEEEELSNKDEPDTAGGPDDNGLVNNEDNEPVLDESSDEDLNRKKRKGKKKSDNRQLRMQVQSAQGKSTSEDGKNPKCKASENQEEL